MPCNSRVVVKATVEIGNVNLDLARVDSGNRFSFKVGSDVTIDIDKRTGKAEIKSSASIWDEGVRQINATIKYLRGKDIIVSDLGQPETHRHDHSGPWQKQGVS